MPPNTLSSPPQTDGARAGTAIGWAWQLLLGVALTLGALYLAAGLDRSCQPPHAACPAPDDGPLPPAPAQAAQVAPPARPVLAVAFVPLPMALAHAAPSVDYVLPAGMRVQDAATLQAAIALDQMTLIAVVEADGHRHALVRLPDGRILRVREGDRLDGGSVAAIGPRTLYMLRTDNSPKALVLGG